MTTPNYTAVAGTLWSTPGNVVPGYLGVYVAPVPIGAAPRYSFKILPPNENTWIDLTKYLEQTQWQITQQFSRQGDTARFYLFDADVFYAAPIESITAALDYTAVPGTGISTPGNVVPGYLQQETASSAPGAQSSLHFQVPPMSQVQFEDINIGRTLFAGVAQKPKLQWKAPNLLQWELACVDYSIYLTYATVQPVTFPLYDLNNNYIDTISKAILYLLNDQQSFPAGTTTFAVTSGIYGINGSLITNANPGGTIQDAGITLTELDVTYQTLQDALVKLSQWASSTETWGFRVDSERNLLFAPASTFAPANVTITDTLATTQNPYDYAHVLNDGNCYYSWDATQLRNNITGIGGNTTITQTDTWLADGTTTQWLLSVDYDPALHGQDSFTVAGIVTPLTVIGGKQPKAMSPWSLAQNIEGIWTLRALNPPAADTSLQLVYHSRQAMIYPATMNYGTTNPYNGPNQGQFAEVLTDSSLKTLDALAARVERELVEYGRAVEEITLTTGEDFLGHIVAGDTITLDLSFVPDMQQANSPVGLSDVFVVTQNTISASQHGAGYRTYQLTCNRLSLQSGISRAQTIQDILYQLNLDSKASVSSTLALIGNFITDEELLDMIDSAVLTAETNETTWNSSVWGLVMAQ